MNWVRQLSSVVLPEPVPPEISVVDAAAADDAQDFGALFGDRAELDQLIERQLVLLELTDGERRAVDRQRRHDDVDARAVRQARVADRRGFVDAAADLADDALADVQQLLVVAEADAGLLDLALDFDVDRAGAVDHDVGDVVARQQRLERAEAEHVVADVVEQFFLLGDRHHDVLDRDDLVDDVADFLARRVGVEPRQLRQIDRLDQRAEDRAFGLVVGFRAARIDRGRHHVDRRRRRASADGADTSGAPSPSDGNGVRPVSIAARAAGFGGSAGCAARRGGDATPAAAAGARARELQRLRYAFRTRQSLQTIPDVLHRRVLRFISLRQQRRRAGRRARAWLRRGR